MRRVFISHASQDAGIAQKVGAALRAANLQTWMAPDDIPPGRPWPVAISSGLASSDVVVLILSKRSNESRQVLREIELADRKRKPVITARLDNAEPTPGFDFFLNSIQWINASADGYELGDKVVESVQRLFENAPTARSKVRASWVVVFQVALMLLGFILLGGWTYLLTEYSKLYSGFAVAVLGAATIVFGAGPSGLRDSFWSAVRVALVSPTGRTKLAVGLVTAVVLAVISAIVLVVPTSYASRPVVLLIPHDSMMDVQNANPRDPQFIWDIKINHQESGEDTEKIPFNGTAVFIGCSRTMEVGQELSDQLRGKSAEWTSVAEKIARKPVLPCHPVRLREGDTISAKIRDTQARQQNGQTYTVDVCRSEPLKIEAAAAMRQLPRLLPVAECG